MDELEKILNLWKEDSVIDQTEPSRELLRIPVLHSKYLDLLSHFKVASKRTEFKIKEMRKLKSEYYSGKLSQEELAQYGWEPFRFTLKSDMSLYLESDPDIIKLQKSKVLQDEIVSVLEAVMQELKQRTWQLKEYCAWERFVSGQ